MVNIGKEYTEILCTVLVIFCKSEVECLTTLIKEKIQKKKTFEVNILKSVIATWNDKYCGTGHPRNNSCCFTLSFK